MARWLNSMVRGVLKESSAHATNAELVQALQEALSVHATLGHHVRDQSQAQRWEVVDQLGNPVGSYWLSDVNEGMKT